jgi:hypothetical protein
MWRVDVMVVVGTSNAAWLIVYAIVSRSHKPLLAAMLQGYLLAWIGHFYFGGWCCISLLL